MGALFVDASNTYFTNTAPAVTTYPFTVGLWIRLSAVGTVVRNIWSLSDTASTNNHFRLYISTAEVLIISAQAGGTENTASGPTLVAQRWYYVIGRYISATNRKMAVLDSTGTVTHASTTTSRNPSSIDTMSLGALVVSGGLAAGSNEWDGEMAEFFYTNSDIQPGGAQLNDTTLRQIALSGPFSMPHIAKDIIEYRAFRSCLASDQDRDPEVYYGAKRRQTWTNTNGVTLGIHPPLYPNYAGPEDFYRPMVA